MFKKLMKADEVGFANHVLWDGGQWAIIAGLGIASLGLMATLFGARFVPVESLERIAVDCVKSE